MKYNVNIGLKIKIFRKMNGLTQEKLAEMVHCNYKTICNIENGKTIPKLKQIINICDVLNINLTLLFDDVLPKSETPIQISDSSDCYPIFVKRYLKIPEQSPDHIRKMTHIAYQLSKFTPLQLTKLEHLIDMILK